MKIPGRRVLLLSIAIAVAAAGCASSRKPLVIDEALKPADIDEVLVLPVIDARASQLDNVLVARNVGDATVRYLRERGYFTIAADRFEQRPSGPLDLHVATAEQLIPLAPEDAKFFMLVQVQKLQPGTDPSQANYEALLSGVLVDRPHRRVVWRDVAGASSSLTGMFTVFSRGSRQYEAAVDASRLLVDSLPDKRAKARPAAPTESAANTTAAAPAAR